MPVYCFICPECDNTQEVVRPMKNSSLSLVCACGANMRRDFAAQKTNAGNKEYAKTKYSDSLAISPSQVEEHRRLFPDVKIDNQGRPGFDSFKQHDSYLEKTGFVKVPQKIRKRGRRLGGKKEAKV